MKIFISQSKEIPGRVRVSRISINQIKQMQQAKKQHRSVSVSRININRMSETQSSVNEEILYIRYIYENLCISVTRFNV